MCSNSLEMPVVVFFVCFYGYCGIETDIHNLKTRSFLVALLKS